MTTRPPSPGLSWLRTSLLATLVGAALIPARGAEAAPVGVQPIDLATVLRLAGAESIEVRRAREQVAEARARHEEARMKFFPWLQPAIGYRRHDGRIQDVGGVVFDASKQSYSLGAGLNAQIELGEAIYSSLAAKQRALAAEHQSETQRQQTMLEAAVAYLELARGNGAVEVTREAVRIAEDYAGQVARAVAAGIAFQGDRFRATGRVEQNRQLQTRTEADRRVAAARLAEVLRLDPTVDLRPTEALLAPIESSPNSSEPPALDLLIRAARANRPELSSADALLAAAAAERKGVTIGPLIPTVTAQANFFGLGGGKNDEWGNFGDGQDYFVGLGWRIGPGGLFDRGRRRAATAREHQTEWLRQQWLEQVAREVVEAHTQLGAWRRQITLSEQTLEAAESTLRLAQDRRDFGVGAVLETLEAEADLTRARLDYLSVVTSANQARFELQRAVGRPLTDTLAPMNALP